MPRRDSDEAAEEAEANLFARTLLMPDDMIAEQWRLARGATDGERVRWMARLFEVSRGLMIARLVELGYGLDLA